MGNNNNERNKKKMKRSQQNSKNNTNNENDTEEKKQQQKPTTITEGSASMTVAAGEDTAVFYNPVQVQNRDLSILMITLYNERRAVRHAKNVYYKQLKDQAKQKGHDTKHASSKQTLEEIKEKVKQYELTLSGRKLVAQALQTAKEAAATTTTTALSTPLVLPGLTILDALAASGLRSMRYWNEIPGIDHVCINDLDPAAVERAIANVTSNQLEHVRVLPSAAAAASTEEEQPTPSETTMNTNRRRPRGILIQQGDAKDVMDASRQRVLPDPTQPPPFHVIDLDPYGSAAPFLDAAIQAVDGMNGGGFLCVTCTDMAALGGSHPETCFGRYGGSMPLQRAQYLQELAVRILLNFIATTAARYGRTMKPILSVGMDFYVRVFVEINVDKAGVNQLSLQTGYVFQSTHCPSFHIVKAGQMGGTKGSVYQAGRLTPDKAVCEETGAALKIGGPLWLGPMHDAHVIEAALERLDGDDDKNKHQNVSLGPAPDLKWIATKDRLRGLLESCLEETALEDAPLYYELPTLAKTIHCTMPPSDQFKAALVNAGYRVSGYHKNPQAVKTNAPNHVVWDIFRVWVQKHPKSKNNKQPSEGSVVAQKILAVEPKTMVDFDTSELRKQQQRTRVTGVARFPVNPQKNWGPKAKATGKKRKLDNNDDDDGKVVVSPQDDNDNDKTKKVKGATTDQQPQETTADKMDKDGQLSNAEKATESKEQ